MYKRRKWLLDHVWPLEHRQSSMGMFEEFAENMFAESLSY